MRTLKTCSDCMWYHDKNRCELDFEVVVPDEPQCEDFDDRKEVVEK